MPTKSKSGDELYIPLRSDKTSFCQRRQVVPCAFISHYVQIKRCTLNVCSNRDQLYIPLRSDKTIIITPDNPARIIFISHYVQIKPEHQRKLTLFWMCFISHYVQIKPFECPRVVPSPLAFISHYVQIKQHVSDVKQVLEYTLYPTTFR